MTSRICWLALCLYSIAAGPLDAATPLFMRGEAWAPAPGGRIPIERSGDRLNLTVTGPVSRGAKFTAQTLHNSGNNR